MSLTFTEKNLAERISNHACMSYTTASHFVGAATGGHLVQLAILIEKHLLQAEQNETLKEYGLTVLDVLIEESNYPGYDVSKELIAQWNERLGTNLITLPEV